jgi:hypothetical protein
MALTKPNSLMATNDPDFVSLLEFIPASITNTSNTDCTTYIQAAIDYCVTNSKGLFVPNGIYLTGPLNLNGTGTVITPGVQANGIKAIKGAGRGYGLCGFAAKTSGLWATEYMMQGNNMVLSTFSDFGLYGDGKAAFGLDLSWDGVNATTHVLTNIFVEGCNLLSINLNNVYDSRISGVMVRGSTSVGITADCQQGMFIADNLQIVDGVLKLAVQNGGVSNSVFADGLEMFGGSFNNFSFDKIHFYQNRVTGVHVNSTATGNATRGCVFTGCYFNPCTYSIAGRYWNGMTFIACQFETTYTDVIAPNITPAAGGGNLPVFEFVHCSFQGVTPTANAGAHNVHLEYCRTSTGSTTGISANTSLNMASYAVGGTPGVSGTITSASTVTVVNGIITNIV